MNTDVEFLGESLDVLCGVRAHREETDHGTSWVPLLAHLLQVQQTGLNEPRSERLGYVFSRLWDRSVGCERSDK